MLNEKCHQKKLNKKEEPILRDDARLLSPDESEMVTITHLDLLKKLQRACCVPPRRKKFHCNVADMELDESWKVLRRGYSRSALDALDGVLLCLGRSP
jgi:hypothetical protein